MSIKGMQGEVDRWITDIGKGYFPPLANMAILTEEVGELARVIVRRYGPQTSKASDLERDLKEELADVLWVVACLANQTGVDLTEAFRKTLEKKTVRDKDRFLKTKD
ncbi:MAG: nucleotide pyrophosphohydrolase [Muribaculaceae bacterium]|nr:nucleotide pyrophosphohydrolase [Muribaculaceae bacterium]